MIYLISLSSNVASARLDPNDVISQALWLFSGQQLFQRATSRVYRAPTIPEGSGPDYLTAVAVIETECTLAQVQDRLAVIEAAVGDKGPGNEGARVLHLELIAPWPASAREALKLRHVSLGSQILEDLPARADVLVPLNEVAPDWVHPGLGLSVQDLVAALPTQARKRVEDFIPYDAARDVAE
ncbi:MAG: 2-amino-4-hydroxy-6-hydroxymethyldihydropteridine diphosphokinase [Pseudomonadota bacterium]